MTRPTEEQVGLCGELIKAHFRQYGNSAAESRLASLVYSIYATLTGDGKPAADHAAVLEAARLAAKPVAAEEPQPDPAPAKEPEPAPAFASGRATPEPEPAPEEKPAADPASEEESEEEYYTREELEAMTVEQLREIAAEGGLEFNSKAVKVDIIEAILSAE